MRGKGAVYILVAGLFFLFPLNGLAEEYSGTMDFNDNQGYSYAYAWEHCVNDLPAGATPDAAEIEIRVKVWYWGVYPGVLDLVCNDEIPINTSDPDNFVGRFTPSTNPSSSQFYTHTFAIKTNHMTAFSNDQCIWFALASRYNGTFYLDFATVTLQATSTAQVATPTFSPSPGTYDTAQQIEIECDTPGAEIYYTTNGDDPTEGSTPYDQPIVIDETTTLKARAYQDGWTPSEIADGIYTINIQGIMATPWIPLLLFE
jgi:hypothetical protein